MADFNFKEKVAGVVLAAGMALGAADGAQASQKSGVDALIAKFANVPTNVESSPAEKRAVIQALSQQSARDPQFDKKLSTLAQYNFSIDVNDRATPGNPGLGHSLSGWSGTHNPNKFTLAIHPSDLSNIGPSLNKALEKMVDVETSDNNRLFREIKSPSSGGSTHQDRLNNYIASRERLEALQVATGDPIRRDPRKLVEENAGRQKYGMPELSASQAAVTTETQRRPPASVPPAGTSDIPQKVIQGLDAATLGDEAKLKEWARKSQQEMSIEKTGSASDSKILRNTVGRMEEVLKENQDKADRMADSQRLSNVDCKGAANNAARGGTTVSAGGRLNVSPADIQQTAKDIMSKPRDQWPSLDKWDKGSLRALKADVSQESVNQLNTVRQALEGIQTGGDREVLSRNIANPVVRDMVAKADISPQNIGSLQRDIVKEIRGNRDALNDLIKDEKSDISQERRMDRAPVVVSGCAPGS